MARKPGVPVCLFPSGGGSSRCGSPRGVTLLAGVLAVTLLLGACGADESPRSNEAAAGASTGPFEDAQTELPEPLLVTPLHAYRMTPTELATVQYAEDLLVQRCMARFGFELPPRRSFADELEAALKYERWDISRVYGISEMEWARAFGYGIPAESEAVDDVEPERSQAFDYVLAGRKRPADGSMLPPQISPSVSPGEVDGEPIPPGGCAGEARDVLGTGDIDVSGYGLAHDLWVLGGKEHQGSQEYRDVIADWVACLAEQGYRVTDPLADRGDIEAVISARLEERPDFRGEPTPEERALALADVGCKQEVELVERLDAARIAIDEAAIAKNQLALQEDRARLDRQVKQATRLVEESLG